MDADADACADVDADQCSYVLYDSSFRNSADADTDADQSILAIMVKKKGYGLWGLRKQTMQLVIYSFLLYIYAQIANFKPFTLE